MANCFVLGVATSLMVLVAPTVTRAEYRPSIDGNELLALCNGIDIVNQQPLLSAQMECLRYIEGVADLWGRLKTLNAITNLNTALEYCLPVGGVAGAVLIEVVQTHLGAMSNAQRGADSAAPFVIAALTRAFPCP